MDEYNLQRFVDAQRGSFERAEKELRAGRKESHRMWHVFPQINADAGLTRAAEPMQHAAGFSPHVGTSVGSSTIRRNRSST